MTIRVRSALRTTWLPLALAAAFIAAPLRSSIAQDAAEPITIALYAPGTYFTDSVARAAFINELANQIEAELGVDVQGQNISSSDDLAGVDLAIIDGVIWAGSEQGSPLASATVSSQTEVEMSLIVSSSGPSRLHELQGKTLILPRAGRLLEDFITHSLLRDEIGASEFFGQIDYTGNMESALAAVEQGRADVTLGFSTYAGQVSLVAIGRDQEGPTPVAVQLDASLDATLVENIRNALNRYHGSGVIEGFTSFDEQSIRRFRQSAEPSRPRREPLMTRPATVTMDAPDLDLPEVVEPLPLGDPAALLDVPVMEEP